MGWLLTNLRTEVITLHTYKGPPGGSKKCPTPPLEVATLVQRPLGLTLRDNIFTEVTYIYFTTYII